MDLAFLVRDLDLPAFLVVFFLAAADFLLAAGFFLVEDLDFDLEADFFPAEVPWAFAFEVGVARVTTPTMGMSVECAAMAPREPRR